MRYLNVLIGNEGILYEIRYDYINLKELIEDNSIKQAIFSGVENYFANNQEDYSIWNGRCIKIN